MDIQVPGKVLQHTSGKLYKMISEFKNIYLCLLLVSLIPLTNQLFMNAESKIESGLCLDCPSGDNKVCQRLGFLALTVLAWSVNLNVCRPLALCL